uniref:ORF37 n=1 Tax=Nitrosopumilaceae spindle-shaped virus TaxID=3065433 RepID=A0AAT9J7E3_9VIRU
MTSSTSPSDRSQEPSMFRTIDKIGFVLMSIAAVILFYNLYTNQDLPSYLIIPMTILIFISSYLVLNWFMHTPKEIVSH